MNRSQESFTRKQGSEKVTRSLHQDPSNRSGDDRMGLKTTCCSGAPTPTPVPTPVPGSGLVFGGSSQTPDTVDPFSPQEGEGSDRSCCVQWVRLLPK